MSRGAAAGAVFLAGWTASLRAQTPVTPIRDNSFLIEEAYNQDRNVVQHIGVYTAGRGGEWAFNFTDEWPVGGIRDQVSAGLTLLGDASGTRFGALALNYRRQMIGGPEAAVVLSPRLSLLADLETSRNTGLGMQVNLPITAVLSGAFVSHWNLGATVGVGPAAVNAGASVVWLASSWMNFLVEGLYVGRDGVAPALVVSPGVRWALNAGAVQVVPGIAFPINLAGRQGDSLLLYFSLEHPFGPTDLE